MWNYSGWGPMHGMWFMPIFGILCLLLVLYFISRVFNGNGGCCGPFNNKTPHDRLQQDELLHEIKALRREVEDLKIRRKHRKENPKDDEQENRG